MSYAVCCVPVAPIRLEPNHKAEMISQILFGECCIITFEEKTGWVRIVNKLDAYTAGYKQLALYALVAGLILMALYPIMKKWMQGVR